MVFLQKTPNAEYNSLFYLLPSLLMCPYPDVRPVNCNFSVRLLISVIQKPKSETECHFCFRHR